MRKAVLPLIISGGKTTFAGSGRRRFYHRPASENEGLTGSKNVRLPVFTGKGKCLSYT